MSDHAASHDTHHDDWHEHSPEEARKHIKIYIGVFVALGILTLVTVLAATELHMPLAPTVALALLIAGVKGSLVAAFFMHLKGEKPVIKWNLVATAIAFALLMILPAISIHENKVIDDPAQFPTAHTTGPAHEGAAAAPAEGHH